MYSKGGTIFIPLRYYEQRIGGTTLGIIGHNRIIKRADRENQKRSSLPMKLEEKSKLQYFANSELKIDEVKGLNSIRKVVEPSSK